MTEANNNHHMSEHRKLWTVGIVVVLLVIHVGLLVNVANQWSPTPDEPAHIAGGLVILQHGHFDVYCVNPPLTRVLGALPAFLMEPEQGWGDLEYQIEKRPEFRLGEELFDAHPTRWRKFLIYGRLMIVPFSILGGLICFFWARSLFGEASGFFALILWCFSPNIITWHAIIGSDGLATSLGVTACYLFWKWTRKPTWSNAFAAGVFLGIVQLAKMSWLIMIPAWLGIGVLALFQSFKPQASTRLQLVGHLAAIMLAALYVLNMGYAFNASLRPLKDYEFFSESLTGIEQTETRKPGNRFSETLLGEMPVPLPADYVRGADIQKIDFETGLESYLLGTWAGHGWWYYYLVGLAIKLPVGTIGLLMIVVTVSTYRYFCASRPLPNEENEGLPSALDYAALLIPGASLFVFVSSQTGFSENFRYVVPTLPFLFILLSSVGKFVTSRHITFSIAIVVLLLGSVASCLVNYPHTLSFYNCAIGGPANGPRYMLGSSFSWRQNIFYLKQWLDTHVKDDLPFLNVDATTGTENFGIEHRGVSPTLPPDNYNGKSEFLFGPLPGWHAIEILDIWKADSGYRYFSQFKPVATIGNTIRVYKLEDKEVAEVRAKLGLPPLASQPMQPTTVEQLRARANQKSSISLALFTGKAETLSTADDPGITNDELSQCLASIPNLKVNRLTGTEIANGALQGNDLVLFPGGNATAQFSELGVSGRQQVRDFVDQGGGYMGICAGAFLGSANEYHGLGLINLDIRSGTQYVPKYGRQLWLDRGFGEVQAELTETGENLLGKEYREFTIYFSGGPIFRPGRRTYLLPPVILANYATEIYKFEFQKESMVASPAIVAGKFGQGVVILSGAHIENAEGLRPLLTSLIHMAASDDGPND